MPLQITKEQKVTYHYPPARQDNTVAEFFGTPVADPYRWMEDPNAPEVRAFIAAQNGLTRGLLDSVPDRAAIQGRLAELFRHPHVPLYSAAVRRGEYYFYTVNPGQPQAIIYRRTGLQGEAEVVLDPNALSPDGSALLVAAAPSPDGHLLAYGLSDGGSDWQVYRVHDLVTGRDFDDVLKWCKFTAIVWKDDGSGFFYNRFAEPAAGEEMIAGNFNSSIYFHRIGMPQSADTLVFADPETPNYLFFPQGSDDGQYLLLNVMTGSIGANACYCLRTDGSGAVVRLFTDLESEFEFIGSVGTTFYFSTKLDAPKKAIITLDITDPDRAKWQTVIPESDDTIIGACLAGEQLVVVYLHSAYAVMKVFSRDGVYLRDIPLPAMGSVGTYLLEASTQRPDFLFIYTSFLYPARIYHYDTTSAALSTFYESSLPVDASQFETRQVFYPSSDGTPVSMFIVHHQSVQPDGTNPTLLYAYGGFDVPVSPVFDAPYYLWLTQGGVFAMANLRGGGEYGEAWHKGGMLERKQQVFDDMIAASEWLIHAGYTSSSHLAIRGMSNGGLLVAACLTQRPDLFGAALCGVPVIDMLRYHRFTSGRLWTGEYGCADTDETEFRTLLAYSPLHNLKAGTTYPPTLIWTADGDDRVVPMHSLKFTAALQAADSGQNPILLRFGTKAGHGTLNIDRLVAEESDFLAFLAATVGWTLHEA